MPQAFLTQPYYPIIFDGFSWGWSKEIQNGRLKKTEFFKTSNSQYFFAKMPEIGPWIGRINLCKEHQCGSTCMVVRLCPTYAQKRSKNTKNAFFPLLSILWTAWLPYRLSHLNSFHIKLSYLSKDQSLKNWQNIENWWFWKNQFFESAILDFFFHKKIFVCLMPQINQKL